MSDVELKPGPNLDADPNSSRADQGSSPRVLSVEQVNVLVKQIVEGQIGKIWIQGEISNFKAHTSGHFYFSLKDARSQINAVMFRGHNARLKFKPHDGLEVIVRGEITVYEPRGSYQVLCEFMEPVGKGALQKAFEQLKEKLKNEGLFDPALKRPLPLFPRRIAVVTSPTGAAIRDIMNVLSRRAPSIECLVVPTIVQGDAAPPKIIEALELAYRIKDLDAIIVGRGGGSMEDLYCFNDENLARTIRKSPVPIISAVGHEIDFTIADFVADVRAPTPSAAAEMVARSVQEMTQKLESQVRLLSLSVQRALRTRFEKLFGIGKRLIDPRRRLRDLILRNDELFSRVSMAVENVIESYRHQLRLIAASMGTPEELIASRRQSLRNMFVLLSSSMRHQLGLRTARTRELISLLDSLSPLKVVERGYAIVNYKGRIVKSVSQLSAGEIVEVDLADGRLSAEVREIKKSR